MSFFNDDYNLNIIKFKKKHERINSRVFLFI